MISWADRPATRPPLGPSRLPGGTTGVQISVTYQPILDVAHGVAAGYQAQIQHANPRTLDVHRPWALGEDTDGSLTASALTISLSASSTLPTNTFLSFPLPAQVAGLQAVREVLLGPDSLAGIVLDIVGPTEVPDQGELAQVLSIYRAAGALISLGGHGAPQPELTSIVGLKPSIIRLGRDWVREVDTSTSKRSAIEVIGTLAGQLNAWILAEGVTTSAELRTLATLSVPLAQGSFIGEAHEVWPSIPMMTRQVLPPVAVSTDGALRGLLQSAHTATDAAAAAAVLPETTGFDVVVIVDDRYRPLTLIEQDGSERWEASEVLAINIGTPVNDAVARAMSRPRSTRFTPLVCTDDQGTFLGVLRIERLIEHLSGR